MFLNDTFTDSDGTALVSHTGELGATWTIDSSFPDSDARITNANRLRGNTGASLSFYAASGTPASADYYVEAVIYVASATDFRAGVIGRLSSGGVQYYAYYDGFTGVWKFNGPGGAMGTYAQALTLGQSYTLRLDMVGTTIRLLVDGVERISVTDGLATLPGKAGVVLLGTMSNSDGLHLDSVVASDPDQGQPAMRRFGRAPLGVDGVRIY